MEWCEGLRSRIKWQGRGAGGVDRRLYAHGHTGGGGGKGREKGGRRTDGLMPTDAPGEGERGGKRRERRWTDGLTPTDAPREGEGKKGEVDRWPYAHGLTEEEGKEEKGGGPMALRPRTHQEKGRGRKGRWTDGLTPTDSPKGEKEEKNGGEGVQKASLSPQAWRRRSQKRYQNLANREKTSAQPGSVKKRARANSYPTHVKTAAPTVPTPAACLTSLDQSGNLSHFFLVTGCSEAARQSPTHTKLLAAMREQSWGVALQRGSHRPTRDCLQQGQL